MNVSDYERRHVDLRRTVDPLTPSTAPDPPPRRAVCINLQIAIVLSTTVQENIRGLSLADNPQHHVCSKTLTFAAGIDAGGSTPKLKPVAVVGADGAAAVDFAGAGVAVAFPKPVEAVVDAAAGAAVVDVEIASAGAGAAPKLNAVEGALAVGAVVVVDVDGAAAAAPKLKPVEAALVAGATAVVVVVVVADVDVDVAGAGAAAAPKLKPVVDAARFDVAGAAPAPELPAVQGKR